jgi:osmotically-inducible protein OsmY
MKTDAQLQQDVIAELKWEPSVTGTNIGVEVKNGIVTLTGHVDKFAEKWHAELAAQRVSGVKAVAVEIDVKLDQWGTKRSDSEIAQSAASALQWQVYLPNIEAIKVIVDKGWVTLSGNVDWDYQRTTAAAAVRYLVGVVGVSNNIIIKPSVSSAAVKADIEAALKRRATTEANNILVIVEGGQVTLSGKVLTWAERDLARQAAWGTHGVKDVTDDLTVASF